MSGAPASLWRCPICGRPFDPQLSSALPFCSERCRQIDLGRWLREVYAVPVTRPPDEEPLEEDRPGGARPEGSLPD
jgi:endogenous inhibitor of DNA gyrase (YacG/DUF329 family)